MRNPIVAETAIANSLVSTVPTTFLAGTPSWDNRTGVVIGPQPPPPVASAKPAINPKMIDFFLVRLIDFFSLLVLDVLKKRKSTYTPRISRNIEMYGFIRSPGKLLKKHAPANAPIDPGMINLKRAWRSTFPNFICEMPDAAVVTTSDR